MLLSIAKNLIQKPSITPHDQGCLDFIQTHLTDLGFLCKRLDHHLTSNLFAKIGSGKPHFCFLGHTDVVPIGQKDLWKYKPFDAVVVDHILYGRGTNDMKGAIACFITALYEFLEKPFEGSISVLLTSDEEGDGKDGIPYVLKQIDEDVDLCLIGEPTAQTHIGDLIKIGSRGSLNARLRIKGKSGHVGYPEYTNNPITQMLDVLTRLKAYRFDEGDYFFRPTNLEITSVDVGNTSSNVIPDQVNVRFNLRFNKHHTGQSLKNWLNEFLKEHDLEMDVTGEAYISDISKYKDKLEDLICGITHKKLVFSTAGATSDGRFIKWPSFELGLFTSQAHQINESIHISDLNILKNIYCTILNNFFI